MLKNKARISWVLGGLIAFFIVVPVYFSIHPRPDGWVGMDKSDEKSQVTTEEVNGKITKTTTTIKTDPAKTLWDWASLFLVPVYLTILGASLGFWLQSSQEKAKAAQAKAEKERDEDRQRDDAIEAYINKVSDLLVGKNLSFLAKQKARSEITNEEQTLLHSCINVIRATTLSIFRRFTDYNESNRTDGERKGSILLFLYETGLIRDQEEDEQGQEDPELKQLEALLSLDGANLSGANLYYPWLYNANLNEANLNNANLSGAFLDKANLCLTKLNYANLSYAKLNGTFLTGAELEGANLSYAYLRRAVLGGTYLHSVNFMNAKLNYADLSYADLSNADLSNADLSNADLSNANLIGTKLIRVNLRNVIFSGAILLRVDLSSVRLGTFIKEQLEGENPPFLCKVKLPQGIEVDPNRDCNDLPKKMQELYPEKFESLEEAQAYVNKQETSCKSPFLERISNSFSLVFCHFCKKSSQLPSNGWIDPASNKKPPDT